MASKDAADENLAFLIPECVYRNSSLPGYFWRRACPASATAGIWNGASSLLGCYPGVLVSANPRLIGRQARKSLPSAVLIFQLVTTNCLPHYLWRRACPAIFRDGSTVHSALPAGVAHRRITVHYAPLLQYTLFSAQMQEETTLRRLVRLPLDFFPAILDIIHIQ